MQRYAIPVRAETPLNCAVDSSILKQSPRLLLGKLLIAINKVLHIITTRKIGRQTTCGRRNLNRLYRVLENHLRSLHRAWTIDHHVPACRDGNITVMSEQQFTFLCISLRNFHWPRLFMQTFHFLQLGDPVAFRLRVYDLGVLCAQKDKVRIGVPLFIRLCRVVARPARATGFDVTENTRNRVCALYYRRITILERALITRQRIQLV